MSAPLLSEMTLNGSYKVSVYEMKIPIPSYLIAIVAGNVV